jgi:hypothetical protein
VLLAVAGGIVLACSAPNRREPSYDVFSYTIPLLSKKPGQTRQMVDQMRAFIWAHWHEHRRGRATLVTTNLTEFVKCTRVYVIEPEPSGDWHIDEDIRCGAGAQGRPKPVTEKYNWCSVKRESLGRVPWLQGEPIPDSANVPASSYELIMTNRSGGRSFPF